MVPLIPSTYSFSGVSNCVIRQHFSPSSHIQEDPCSDQAEPLMIHQTSVVTSEAVLCGKPEGKNNKNLAGLIETNEKLCKK